MISLVFIRHGATKGNLEKRYIGSTDESLCEVGVSQGIKLKEYDLPDEYIFVSPMKRAIETAQIVFPDKEYIIVEDFKESDFGIFEGKTALELSESEEYRLWVDSMCKSPIPQGENIDSFKKRCINAFNSIIKSLPDNAKVSFIVHGGVIMAILEALSDEKCGFYDYHIENGEFICGQFENGKIKVFKYLEK